MNQHAPSIQPLGDSAVLISWPGGDDRTVASLVQQAAVVIRNHPDCSGFAVVPAFVTLAVHYLPERCSWESVHQILTDAINPLPQNIALMTRRVEIPVCYDAAYAMDIDRVAQNSQLTPHEVIRRHSEAEYTVRMIGFSPGFPYLAGLPPELHCPRHSTPRLRVQPGDVAIGGSQAGIYSRETPGGWNIIGRTPAKLFDPDRVPPCLLQAGDEIRFVAIDIATFKNMNVESSCVR